MNRHEALANNPRRIVALHINAAGECRRAAMESARTGEVVGFYGPELHKLSVRNYLADARARRCKSDFTQLPR